MRPRPIALALAVAAACVIPATASSAAGGGDRTCTWGGTPAAPTGVITFTPGITNMPSPGPTRFKATGELDGGAGCRGRLTFIGTIDPGTTCAINAPFHARAAGLPHVARAEARPGLGGTQPVLLYDGRGNVVGSEQAQFLTGALDQRDPAFTDCGTPQGLVRATWSDTVELVGIGDPP
jgi:hypothetical protein